MTSAGTETTRRVDDDRNPSAAVIDLLARVEGVDPLELDPLYAAIDPDALDAVCTSGAGFESIAFTYGEYCVTVTNVGDELEVSVERESALIDDPCSAADSGSVP